MTYYNSTTKTFYRGGALKAADGTIFNPTAETLAKHGFESYAPPPAPEPEPIPASELRRQAYEAECDPYSMAYVGYMLEGNEEAAAGCKAAYLAKKAEIRTRIPDKEKSSVQAVVEDNDDLL